MRLIGFCIASLALTSSASAQTRDRACITPTENEAVVAYVLPDLVRELGSRCDPHLGNRAFLGSRAAASLQRKLEPQSERAWPRARDAAKRFAGSRLPVEGQFESIAKAAIAPAAAMAIAQGFDPDQCRLADRLLVELAPLPAENFASVMAIFLELGIAENEDVPFRVCRSGS